VNFLLEQNATKDAPHYWVEGVNNAPNPSPPFHRKSLSPALPPACIKRFVLGEGPGPDSGPKNGGREGEWRIDRGRIEG